MKYAVHTAAAVAALACLPALAPALAQNASVFVEAQTQEQYLARDHLIGAKVYGQDGKIVGDVEDLIVDASNQVVGVVLGTGGYFGLAEKKVGVALSALTFEDKDSKATVTLPGATATSLAAAPEFKRTRPEKSLLERAREKALELSDKTTASTKDAYEKAKPAIEDAKKKAEDALEKAKEAAAPAIEKAKEAADEAKKALTPAEEAPMAPAPEAATPAPVEPAPEAAAPPPAAPETAPDAMAPAAPEAAPDTMAPAPEATPAPTEPPQQ